MDGRFRTKGWLSTRFELSRGGENNFLAMEGLRGLAVILVFIVHANSVMSPWLSSFLKESLWFEFMTNWGHSGVDLFFILSGYLIYGSIIRVKSFSLMNYAHRRAKRILPTFYFTLFIYVVLNISVDKVSGTLPDGLEIVPFIISQMLLVPMLFGNDYLVEVSWTLTYEFTFYAIAPIVLLGMRMRDLTSSARVGVVLALVVFGAIFFFNIIGPVRCMLFLSGILIYELRDVQGKRLPSWVGGAGFFIASLYIGFNDLFGLNFVAAVFVMMLGYGALVFVSLGNPVGLLSFLQYAPLRYLGNMSYSYYLIHGLIIHAFFMVFGNFVLPAGDIVWMYLPLMLFAFLSTLVGSAIVFLMFEKRFSL
jgi:exopolysaccharide production protein ExoZ